MRYETNSIETKSNQYGIGCTTANKAIDASIFCRQRILLCVAWFGLCIKFAAFNIAIYLCVTNDWITPYIILLHALHIWYRVCCDKKWTISKKIDKVWDNQADSPIFKVRLDNGPNFPFCWIEYLDVLIKLYEKAKKASIFSDLGDHPACLHISTTTYTTYPCRKLHLQTA